MERREESESGREGERMRESGKEHAGCSLAVARRVCEQAPVDASAVAEGHALLPSPASFSSWMARDRHSSRAMFLISPAFLVLSLS